MRRRGAVVVLGLLLFGIGFKIARPTSKHSPHASSPVAAHALTAKAAFASTAIGAGGHEAAGQPVDHHDRHAAAPNALANDDEAESDLLLARVRAAGNSESSNAFLVDTLSSTDEAAKLEAIDALVARKHTAALPKIIQMDPVADPYVGPSVIVALGELGAATTNARDRDATLDRLLTLLKTEKERRGSDSAGYIVTIIEALGRLHHPASAAPLERELFDLLHDVSTRTTIVLALKEIGQRSSIAPLMRLRGLPLSAAAAGSDEHTEALNKEFIAAIDDALQSLSE